MKDEPSHTNNIELEKGKIVIVEDNQNDAELVRRVYRKLNLADQAIFLEDGEAALAYLFAPTHPDDDAARRTPGVIFLDLKLPKIDGMEVLRRLKSDEHTRSIPVVIFSSSTEEKDLKTAYHFGANSYVIKPIPFDEFSNIVRELVLYWLQINQLPL